MDNKTKNSIKSEPVAKKPKLANDKIYKIMENMGWEGKGLGAQSQGIEEPIEAVKHAHRHGIGLADEHWGIERPDTVWSEGADEASASGDIVAHIQGARTFFENQELAAGELIGERRNTIEREHTFCDQFLLGEMLKCKSVLDKYTSIIDARSRSNTYEKIGAGFFLNRAAMKMANLDHVFNNLFTSVANNETLFFADICAGPGGFTEYMLWKRPLQSCGFGFTLKGKDDFKLRNILCGPVECFHPSYGKYDDGDVTNEENLRHFQLEVMKGTSNIGVHTVLADGGFDVSGSESIQELKSKQLYLCQFLCAINILRTGGNFLCKLFDTFTDFSVGLIHLVSTLFDQISIVKPITSRPANSERYIVFQNFTSQSSRVEEIRNFLYKVNKDLNDLKDTERDVIRIIQHNIIKKDIQFYQFIKDINNKILKQQIMALAKLHSFLEDPNLNDDRQMDIRKEALELWEIPDEIKRDAFLSEKANPVVSRFLILTNYKNRAEKLKAPAQKSITPLKEIDFLRDKFCVRNHFAAFLSHSISEMPKSSLYVIVKDKKSIHFFPDNSMNSQPLPEAMKNIYNIPSFTILLVNFGVEFSGKKGNRKHNTLVIVDSPMIYGEDISELPYEDRMHKVANLCSLLDPKTNGIVRPVDYFPLSDIKNFVARYLSIKKCKGAPEQEMVTCRKIDHFYVPDKLIIMNQINEPWLVAISQRTSRPYFYNAETKESNFEKPEQLHAAYQKSNIYLIDREKKTEFDYKKLLNLIDKKQ